MSLPVFYYESSVNTEDSFDLPEETVRHIVQVLRMKEGEELYLTNGKGTLARAVILQTGKKKCTVRIASTTLYERKKPLLVLGVAFTKSNSRNEWLLEKATELGVSSIIPLSVRRSERQHMRTERWKSILISAMIQSQQNYLPELLDPKTPEEVLNNYQNIPQRIITHCLPHIPRTALTELITPGKDCLILTGPEGDFTEEEVTLCMQAGFRSGLLGSQRLRTETAAMSVCAYFNLIQHEH